VKSEDIPSRKQRLHLSFTRCIGCFSSENKQMREGHTGKGKGVEDHREADDPWVGGGGLEPHQNFQNHSYRRARARVSGINKKKTDSGVVRSLKTA